MNMELCAFYYIAQVKNATCFTIHHLGVFGWKYVIALFVVQAFEIEC